MTVTLFSGLAQGRPTALPLILASALCIGSMAAVAKEDGYWMVSASYFDAAINNASLSVISGASHLYSLSESQVELDPDGAMLGIGIGRMTAGPVWWRLEYSKLSYNVAVSTRANGAPAIGVQEAGEFQYLDPIVGLVWRSDYFTGMAFMSFRLGRIDLPELTTDDPQHEAPLRFEFTDNGIFGWGGGCQGSLSPGVKGLNLYAGGSAHVMGATGRPDSQDRSTQLSYTIDAGVKYASAFDSIGIGVGAGYKRVEMDLIGDYSELKFAISGPYAYLFLFF